MVLFSFVTCSSDEVLVTTDDIYITLGNPRIEPEVGVSFDIFLAVTQPADPELCSANTGKRRKRQETLGRILLPH